MEAGLSQGGMTNLDGSSVGPGTSMTLSLGDGSSVYTVDRHLGGDNETASLKALAGSIASSASRGHRSVLPWSKKSARYFLGAE
jgi:hypothetical protein